MDGLPTDVEQALQHAIGQANSAFVGSGSYTGIDQEGARRKKGKKRARNDPAREGEQPKKKRKKKRHSHPEDGIVESATESNIDPSLLGPAGVERKGEKSETSEKNKKSKKKKHASAGPVVSDDPGLACSTIDLPALLDRPPTSASPNYPELPEQPFPNPSLGLDYPPLNTNDDILRAFQDLDLARLAGVLRSLDLPPSPSQSKADLNSTDTLFASLLGADDHDQDAVSPAVTVPTTARSASLARPSRARAPAGPPTTATKRPAKPPRPAPEPNPNLAAIGPSIANPAHTQLLATKWLNPAKLKALEETEGLVYKKGKFSTIEDQALKTSIENYRVTHGLSPEQITEIVFSKTKEEHKSFWTDITVSVPARPIIAVYHHVRRLYHPLKLQGKWSEAEDVALTQSVTDLGHAWEKISQRVGRAAQDCRDRWRNHIVHRSEKQKGPWSKHEEEELTRIVKELQKGSDSDNDIFWGIVSQRMGNKRGMQQCRIKWTDALSKAVKSGGQSPRWNKQDAFILVHKVASLDVRDDSEIDWKLLPDADWNLWSAHNLQRRWRSMKHAIKGHEAMAFQDILDILVQKNDHIPPVNDVAIKLPRKEPKSAAVIEDEEAGQTRSGEGPRDDQEAGE